MSSKSSSTLDHEIRRGGDAVPLVLLHSLALDRSMWGPLLDHIGDDRQVVTLDLPGHGASVARRPLTIEGMADDVAATLDELGYEHVVLVGVSMGGCVAQAFAIDHPERVVGLGLFDTTAWYGPDAALAWEDRATRAQAEGLASLADFQLERWFTASYLEREPERCRRLLDVFVANDVPSYVAACRAMGSVDLRDGLATVSVPTVIAVGEEDGATPPHHAADIRSRVAGATLTIIPDAKHLAPVEQPEPVARLLEPLLYPEA